MATEQRELPRPRRRPMTEEELELLGEGAAEQAEQALELAELAATATYDVVQTLDD